MWKKQHTKDLGILWLKWKLSQHPQVPPSALRLVNTSAVLGFSMNSTKSSRGFYSLSLQDIGPLVAGDICGHETRIKRPIQLNQTEFCHIAPHFDPCFETFDHIKRCIFWASNFLLNPSAFGHVQNENLTNKTHLIHSGLRTPIKIQASQIGTLA